MDFFFFKFVGVESVLSGADTLDLDTRCHESWAVVLPKWG